MSDPAAPRAKRVPTRREHHGDVFDDPYEWLRAKDDPEVIAHLQAENAYAEASTAHLEGLREQIFQEIKGRTLETDLSVPAREGGWWYYSRSFEGRQYGVQCRAPIADIDDWTPPAVADVTADRPALPGEQVIFDQDAAAEGHEFFSLGSFDVSSDGRWLAYAVDTEGDERYTLRIRDLETGRDLDDEVHDTSAGAFFTPDARHVFYTTVDESWRPDTVWRHEVGTSAELDAEVFHESDERFWLGAGLTRSRRFIEIGLSSQITSESWIIDADDPAAAPRLVWPRTDGVEVSVEHAVIDGEDRLLLLTNEGDALDFELRDVPVDDPQAAPRILIPHTPGVRLDDVDAFADRVVVGYRRDGLTRLGVVDTRDGWGPLTEIEFDEPLYTVGASGNPEWSQPTVRLHYGSLVTPSTLYDYVPASGELRLLKRQPVLGGYDPSAYEQRREWATATDGTRVPISLVYRRELVTPGTPAPLELYGYGSYESSIDPYFSIARLSLLDRGVVFAIAHVRGGGELGRSWYENGKKLAKKNSFSDFVACARQLIASGWTTPSRLVAEGASAGGLLMGAVANLAPELFAGILADVPFVDALTSILDPSLPLTVIEWDEWGDPLHDPAVYAYMKSYSPYENLRADATYPPILASTSLNDTRVLYVEPAKWVAALRELGAPAYLKIELVAGHGGVSGRYSAWHQRAWELAWLLDRLGLAGDSSSALAPVE